MTERSTPSVSSICRKARLSLQKAALSRRSHMLSEELEHLRDFESLISETLPLHPEFAVKREQKELLELDFHLLNVKGRLAEIERKHPFLYTHHRKGGRSFYDPNGKSKRSKEIHDKTEPEKKKTWSSYRQTPLLSSSSSASASSRARGLSASYLSQSGRRLPPTPSKRSLSTSCSPSPILKSSPSNSKCFRSLKRSLALRSPLNNNADDAGCSSEKLTLRSLLSNTCKDPYHRQKRPMSSQSFKDALRSKCVRDHKSSGSIDLCEQSASGIRFPEIDLHLSSSNSEHNAKSSFDVAVNGAGFLSHGHTLPKRHNGAKCRSPYQGFAGEIDVSSIKASLANNYQACSAPPPDIGDESGNDLMDAPNSDFSDNVEMLDPTWVSRKEIKQRSRNLAGRLQLPRNHDSHDSFGFYNDDISLLNLASDTIHGMKAYPASLKKVSLHSRTKDTGRQRRYSSKGMHSSLDDPDFLLKSSDFSNHSHKTTGKRPLDSEKRNLETGRALSDRLCMQPLGEAPKRTEGSQQRNGCVEERETFPTKKSLSRQFSSLKFNSETEGAERLNIVAEHSSCASMGAKRALFGKDWNLEVRHSDFPYDQLRAENAEKWEHESEEHLKGEFGWQDRAREDDIQLNYDMGKDVFHGKTEVSSVGKEVFYGKVEVSSMGKNATHEQFEVSDMGKDAPHGSTEVSSSISTDHKKMTTCDRRALDDPLASDSQIFVEANVQSEFGRPSPKCRHPSANPCAILSDVMTTKCLVSADINADGLALNPSRNQFVISSHDASSSTIPSSVSFVAASPLPNSLSRLSPQNSSEIVSANLVFKEIDAHSCKHKDICSLNGEHVTFCNPIFDFDNKKHYLESTVSPRPSDPPDTSEDTGSPSEERLKSILGECSYAANQLNSNKGLGLDRESSPIVESQVSPLHEDAKGNLYDVRDMKLQVNELTRRMNSFQKILNELNKTMQNSFLHVQQQVDNYEAKMKSMERQVSSVKQEIESEILDLKRLVKTQLNVNHSNEGSKRSSEGNNYVTEGRMQANIDASSLKLDALQKRVDTWISKMHVELRSQVDDAVGRSMQKFGSLVKTDLEKLELQREKDLGNLKKEMGIKLSLHESKDQLNRISEKQLDVMVKDVLENKFSRLMEMFSAEKDREITQIKIELANLQRECEVRFQGRSTWARGRLVDITHKNGQLDLIHDDGLHAWSLVNGLKTETDANLHDIELSIDELKLEIFECRERIFGLERVLSGKEESISREIADVYKLRTSRSPI